MENPWVTVSLVLWNLMVTWAWWWTVRNKKDRFWYSNEHWLVFGSIFTVLLTIVFAVPIIIQAVRWWWVWWLPWVNK